MKVSNEVIINALLTCKTNQLAADACGITREQLSRRIRDPVLQKELKEARRLLLESATRSLQSATSGAVDVMVSIMEDEQNAPQVRLNASESIMRNCLKMTEQCDIIQRIEELEAKLNAE